ncbi:MAG: hypothetical protein ACI8WB_002937 [Phenylobacterium sp.]|jgi:hypothetical protein
MSKNTEIRVAVDTDFLKKVQKKLGLTKSTDITRAALTLLDWASDEMESNRVILSTNQNGEEIHRLVMPELSKIKVVS